ncbi:hypothetical protein, partial [Sansalvadorimonas verongulae]|uniref:hypothetical protein n=1 Tax=Sansalvadorimonas verongulae TaxID=2172824 RepID=UPI001E649766
YQATHANGGGGITVCWFEAAIGSAQYQTGHHIPQSAAELNALMTEITDHCPWDTYDRYLRTAFRLHDALVLDADDLTAIAQEFINGLKLDTKPQLL